MSPESPKFAVVAGHGGKGAPAELVDSPHVPPLIALDTSERRVWKYICESLSAAGLEHITAGLPIAIIVRTYTQWLDAVKKCETAGRYQQSQNGWSSEQPWAADERRLKSELGQWLPKACLTIPSATRVKKDMGIGGGQDDLFAELVGHAQERPSAAA
jgi:hypothetical protein